MEKSKSFIRPYSKEITILEALNANFIQKSAEEPNAIFFQENEPIYNINIIGIVLNVEKIGTMTNLLLEDGTEKIVIRFFEEKQILSSLEAGNIIKVIGKIRKYNEERYISPEIVKKMDSLWMKIRFLKIKLRGSLISFSSVNKSTLSEEELVEDNNPLPSEKIFKLIKEMDKGEGVRIEELVEKSSLDKTEEILQKMIEEGDLFQNLPGKVKIL
ncbi:hypothetical protein J4444_04055 [Candidatus Woesearchaeota archaeon]|nr:hypothetical protein [Candidatus Woesearchaeota archaeon]